MESEAVVDVPPPEARAGSRKGPLAIVLLVAALVGVAAFFVSYQRGQAEAAAAKALNALGAIVVMDPSGSHAASLNLSTLQTADDIAAAVKHLGTLRHVTTLDASRTSIGDDAMAAIAAMPALASLALNETSVTDKGAQQLSGIAGLTALFLVKTSVSDQSLEALAKLHGLHILDLSATKVTSNLAPLTALPELEWLLLREAEVTDEGLAALATCPKLNRLSLEGAKYSEQAATKLQQAIPGLSIDR